MVVSSAGVELVGRLPHAAEHVPHDRGLGTVELPTGATYWMPKLSEMDEEGIGFFRGVWTIIDVPLSAARKLADTERRLATAVADLAATAEDFDRLAGVVETGLGDDRPDVTLVERATLDPLVSDESPLDGLNLASPGWSTHSERSA